MRAEIPESHLRGALPIIFIIRFRDSGSQEKSPSRDQPLSKIVCIGRVCIRAVSQRFQFASFEGGLHIPRSRGQSPFNRESSPSFRSRCRPLEFIQGKLIQGVRHHEGAVSPHDLPEYRPPDRYFREERVQDLARLRRISVSSAGKVVRDYSTCDNDRTSNGSASRATSIHKSPGRPMGSKEGASLVIQGSIEGRWSQSTWRWLKPSSGRSTSF